MWVFFIINRFFTNNDEITYTISIDGDGTLDDNEITNTFYVCNGENENIYLESDYTAFDHKQMVQDLEEYEKAKQEQIAKLEKHLQEKIALANSIIV